MKLEFCEGVWEISGRMILGEGHDLPVLADDEYLVVKYFEKGLYVPEIKKMELEPVKGSDNTVIKRSERW